MIATAYTWHQGALGNTLSLHDRGLNFGDGCFTTIRLDRDHAGDWHCHLWPWHLQRLMDTCARLDFACPDDLSLGVDQVLQDQVLQTGALDNDADYAVLRITLTRGDGGSGYSPDSNSEPRVIFRLSAYPEHYHRWQEQGIVVGWAGFQLAVQPAFAGLKTLNRLEQVALKQELARLPYDDLIVSDRDGCVVEASAGNVFWRSANQWFTPTLSHAGVDGVVRQWLIGHNPDIQVVRASSTGLLHCDEAFVCNALMGLVPIRSIAERKLRKIRNYSATMDTGLLPKSTD